MAARYWIGGGTNQNWNSSPTTNWSATSGGVVRVAAPTSADDVFFDGAGASGNSNSTISTGISCLSFTVTGGYTQTITHNGGLIVAGNVTLNTSYTIAGSSSLTISATSTITSNGKTWPNGLIFTGVSTTKTIAGGTDFIVLGALLLNIGGLVLNTTSTEKLQVNGIGGPNDLSGTAEVVLTGGTWVTTSSGIISNNLTIAGSVTISGTVRYSTGLLSYSSGSVSGGVLFLAGSCTLNTSGLTFDAVTTTNTSGQTYTINSTLSIVLLTLGTAGTQTFVGTSGWTCATLSNASTGATTITLKEAITYTVTTLLSCFTTRTGSSLLFTSAHGTTKANLTLSWGATCRCLSNFTRIDASGGRPIRAFNSTITDCVYIQSISDLKTVAA